MVRQGGFETRPYGERTAPGEIMVREAHHERAAPGKRGVGEWVFTPILAFPRRGGRDWIPAFAGMTDWASSEFSNTL